MKLNVGCGKNIRDGWINIDIMPLPGVDVVFDLETCVVKQLPFDDDSVDEIFMSHTLEHISNALPLMEELHRVAKNGAIMEIRVPHGSSNDAWEDPTHVRVFYEGSFQYFSQPIYHFADYGYRGDWRTNKVILVSKRENFSKHDSPGVIMTKDRNMICEMIANMTAIKPIRCAGTHDNPGIEIQLAE